ncbi:MAG: low molecular weight protein-tyrosine-phosphatase [Deinococcales bacterium]
MKVLFVCHGNICRSPMAEGMLRQACAKRGLGWQIDSAGLSAEHSGEDMHPNTKKILSLHGAYFKHSARQILPSDSEFDLILAATRYQARLLQKRFPNSNIQTMLPDADVPDPWYGTYADYEAVYAMLEPMIEQLVLESADGSKA